MHKVILGLAIALVLAAAPALAQQKGPSNDRVMERAVAQQEKAVNALNKRDAAAVAALYTADGVSSIGSDLNAGDQQTRRRQ